MAVWRWTAQSWAGISQPMSHFEGCFAAAKPPFGTQVPLRRAIWPFRSCEMGCKNPLLYKMLPPLRKQFPRLKNGMRSSFLCLFFPFSCKMISNIQNDLQAIKMTCKMKRGLWKHLAKPREVAKMPTKPHDHAYEEESPLTEITHTKPLISFLTSLNHQSP